ncbi:hypothetical protein GCM10027425_06720 [Alteromonas gracilis]
MALALIAALTLLLLTVAAVVVVALRAETPTSYDAPGGPEARLVEQRRRDGASSHHVIKP